MLGRRTRMVEDTAYPAEPVLADPALRDEPDPDPVVEAATARLRERFRSIVAVDEWGRPVAYRHLARVALAGLPEHVRQALREVPTTTVDLAALERRAVPGAASGTAELAATRPGPAEDAAVSDATDAEGAGVAAGADRAMPVAAGGSAPLETGIGWV